MRIFNKLKVFFSSDEKNKELKKELKVEENIDVKLSDTDILYSLNYNIFIKKRDYKEVSQYIIFEEYKSFKFIEEMKDFYEIDEGYIIFYMDKYEKFRQLVNNISIYLELDNIHKLMYDYRDYSLFSNIFEIILKEKQKEKKFDIMEFFSRFEWVKKCEKLGNTSLKIDLYDNNNIEIRYRILEKERNYILGKFRDELIKIDFTSKKIFFGLKIQGEKNG